MIYPQKETEIPIIKKLKEVSAMLDKHEEVMQLNAMRMNLALRAMNAGIWEWDIRNNIVKWDKTLIELLGVDPHTLSKDQGGWYIGNFKKFISLVHPDDVLHMKEFMRQCKKNLKTSRTQFRILSNNILVNVAADSSTHNECSLVIGVCVPNDPTKI